MRLNFLKKIGWFAALVLFSCSDNTIPVLSDRLYYPIHANYYWDYSVSQTDILQTTTCVSGGQTVSNYQLRMVVTDSLTNGEGGITFVIHRYTRPDASSSWADLDTWSVRTTSNSVIQSEGNVSYVKLVFPLSDSLKWNGNLYNDQAAENYIAVAVGKPFSSHADNYTKTATIFQSRYDDFFISRDQRNEVYAYTIGLVYKKIDQRTFFQEPCYGQQIVQKGLIYEQWLIAYGKL